MKRIAIFFTLAWIQLHICAKLPSQFQHCNRKEKTFNDCLAKAIQDAARSLKEPIKEYGLPSLYPLKIPSLTIGAGSGPVAVEQIYKDMNLSGFQAVTCSEANMDFDKKKLSMSCKFPDFLMEFTYELNGHIMMLPIKGNGPGNISLKDLEYNLSFDLEQYTKKNNAKHYKVIKSTLSMMPDRISFKLDNLFGGDKALADNIMNLMNENWRDIYADVQASYEEAFAQISGAIFNKLLAKVSINEMFGDE